MHSVIADGSLAASPFDETDARAALREMITARRFDERAIALQRRGWMSGYPPFKGQEAAQIGAAQAMADDDVLVPTYRSNALQIARGVPMSDLLLFRRGFPEYHSDHDVPVFPQAVPIGSQIPHAAGVGMAARLRGADHAALVCFGDGATSQGDFHEGCNFAGVFDAQTVFFCENNGWAISLPETDQTASETIAQKANAYGFEGRQVDGNDPLAVREAVAEALASARDGDPVLIEALTYRQGAHTTADDPERYREAEPAFPDWRTADPIDRLESWLLEQDVIEPAFRESAREAATDRIQTAVETAESVPRPEPAELFDPVYEELSPELQRQRDAARRAAETTDSYELDR